MQVRILIKKIIFILHNSQFIYIYIFLLIYDRPGVGACVAAFYPRALSFSFKTTRPARLMKYNLSSSERVPRRPVINNGNALSRRILNHCEHTRSPVSPCGSCPLLVPATPLSFDRRFVAAVIRRNNDEFPEFFGVGGTDLNGILPSLFLLSGRITAGLISRAAAREKCYRAHILYVRADRF